MSEIIPQMEPWFGPEEKQLLINYMDEGGWLTEHKRTKMFESQLAEYTGAKHCIVVNNGTISLTLAALALGVGHGDEVIVPNYTMIATPNSVKMIGATPIFVDVEPSTLCISLAEVESAITSKTKAIIFVSANGRYPSYSIDALIALAAKHNLFLIEDSAQSLGSHYPSGQHIGTVGHVGSFSFSAPKVISTGQGGALVTNDDDIAFRLQRLKDFGRSGGGNDIHDSIGYNFKFTELQACVGLAQMAKLPWRVERKKDILKRYQSNLSQISQIRFFDQDLVHTTPWFIDVLAENRDALKAHLADRGIGSRVMYPPINQQKAYSVSGTHSVSALVGRDGLWLPSASQLKDEEIDRVCTAILDFYG